MLKEHNNESDQDKEKEESSSRFLNKRQKVSIILLAIFGIIVITFWIVQFKNRLNSPFEFKGEIPVYEESQEDENFKDTDGDGLPDWDEINIYGTSPYLEDTDGDRINDKDEIEGGYDPNCPSGEQCYDLRDTNNEIGENLINELTELSQKDQIIDVGQGDSSEEELINVIQGGSDADQLRKVLIESGMPEELLKTVGDEDLLDMYNQMLEQ